MDNHGIFGRWVSSGPGELVFSSSLWVFFKVRNNVGKLLQDEKRAQEISLYLTFSNVFVHTAKAGTSGRGIYFHHSQRNTKRTRLSPLREEDTQRHQRLVCRTS